MSSNPEKVAAQCDARRALPNNIHLVKPEELADLLLMKMDHDKLKRQVEILKQAFEDIKEVGTDEMA